MYKGLIEKYRSFLPFKDDDKVISLSEGDTPLIPLLNIPVFNSRGVKVYAKFEGLNPTGSFKDRGMTMAISKAVSNHSKAVICASTGNTSASAAAYAARAAIPCFVVIPAGKIALGKLAQAMVHGAKVVQIQGNFDDGMKIVKELSETDGLALVNSVNPYRLQGQKTAAFEIVEQLGRAPDFHCIPVGNAGNISAYWMGFNECCGERLDDKNNFIYKVKKSVSQLPVMLGYQASGAAPLVTKSKVPNPETIATAIRIGSPQSKELAEAASEDSGGWFKSLSDKEILEVQTMLAEKEGIFCEPASAISLGGALVDTALGKIPEGSTITCTLTGHGLKDPDTVIEQFRDSVFEVEAEKKSVISLISRFLK